MKVIGIKFKDGGKIYYFAPNEGEEYEAGVQVVVETSKGLEFANGRLPAQRGGRFGGCAAAQTHRPHRNGKG